MVLKLPAMLVHRFLIVLIASGLCAHITFSIQAFFLVNLAYSMFVFNFKPNAARSSMVVERFTVVVVHFNILLLMLFTDFVTSSAAQYYYSISYMFGIGLIFSVHLATMFYNSLRRYLSIRKARNI